VKKWVEKQLNSLIEFSAIYKKKLKKQIFLSVIGWKNFFFKILLNKKIIEQSLKKSRKLLKK
jgi:hypothetical protein